MYNISGELLASLIKSRIIHYIVRSEPQLDKPALYVEAINALNPFVKPGYRFVSVTTNEKNLNEF